MEIGIIGFQKSGKTTVFNALTGQEAAVSAFAMGKAEPNLAVVLVPDERLEKLAALFEPKKTTHATVRYVDLAGIVRGHDESSEALGEAQLNAISQSDALMAVLRGFENAAGEAPGLRAEAEAILLEMALSDLKKAETRLERLAKARGKAGGDEAKRNATEEGALLRLKEMLEHGRPIREAELSEDEDRVLRGFRFLTQKPLLLVVNAPESALGGGADPTEPIRALGEAPSVRLTWIAGQSEMEIVRLAPEERQDFLAEYRIAEPASAKIIRLSYELLGFISFFTVGPEDCHAWTVRRGTPAQEAAGAIHSDMQRGFIRGEVCRWDELAAAGSFAELKKHGTLRLEGKTYEVQDGDVMHVLFSV
ncbi:MAG: DUF933 domain-containing protein [Candidatus Sumerlaeota bacterium]|nr:DUF933 domain-containing protein [Candidatus Sumerlaeota bacterium]